MSTSSGVMSTWEKAGTRVSARPATTSSTGHGTWMRRDDGDHRADHDDQHQDELESLHSPDGMRRDRTARRVARRVAAVRVGRRWPPGMESGQRRYTRPSGSAFRRLPTDSEDVMTQQQDGRERWAVVLGASSGFGGAVSKGWAGAGYNIIGVHLDMRGTIETANAVRDAIAATGVQVVFHNVNAADDEKRAAVVACHRRLFEERRAAGADPYIAAFLHSLAFGATLPYITEVDGAKAVAQADGDDRRRHGPFARSTGCATCSTPGSSATAAGSTR